MLNPTKLSASVESNL
ncbi:unnamed protein product, partial [Rotaria magnacalcarata]